MAAMLKMVLLSSDNKKLSTLINEYNGCELYPVYTWKHTMKQQQTWSSLRTNLKQTSNAYFHRAGLITLHIANIHTCASRVLPRVNGVLLCIYLCRFAHCTREQESVYRRTGLLPVGAQRKLTLDYALTRALMRGETPVCIDFLKTGQCKSVSLFLPSLLRSWQGVGSRERRDSPL